MKKIYIVFLVLPFFLLFKPDAGAAFTVDSVNDIYGVYGGSLYYEPANGPLGLPKESIRFDYLGSDVVRTIHSFNPPDGAVREYTTGTWFMSSGFTCVGKYNLKAFNASGTLLLEINLTIEEGDLIEPSCDSENANPTPDEPTDCSALICECIADLQIPLKDINDSIGQTNLKLDTVNANLGDIKLIAGDIKAEIISFHDEFRGGADYSVKPLPDTKNLLDQNKPAQPTAPFTDSNTYFSDQGDSTEPLLKLPKAPEPKDWEGFLPDLAMPPEAEKTKEPQKTADSVMPKDLEMQRDNMLQDAEMQKDAMSKDLEMQKDAMSADLEMQKEADQQKDAEMQKDAMQQQQFAPTESYQQNNFYEQTNVFP